MVLCLLPCLLAGQLPTSGNTADYSQAIAKPPSRLVVASASSGSELVSAKGNEAIAEFWQARGEPGKFGGSITVATFGTGIKTFNPWQATDVESHGIGQLIFESLIDVDPWTGKPLCRLARSYTVSSDGLEYTFTLRRGLRWSDGKPITADDIVFTFDKLIKEGFGNKSLKDTIAVENDYPTVKKIDDLTVKFRTAHTFAPFLSSLQGISIAPKHALEKYTIGPNAHEKFPAVWDINSNPREMVTSGPFKVDRYVPSQRIELVRNPNYAMCDIHKRRLPYLNRFTEAIVPDQNAMLIKFYGNELDLLDIRSIRGPDAALMKQREATGNFKMYNLGPDDGTMFLIFNMNRRRNPKTGQFYVDPVKQQWFNNVYFRQAVSHGINRTTIVNNVLRGVGSALYGPESPASVYVNKSLKPYPQDLKLAEALLQKGGFQKRGSKLYDKDGHFVEFTLNTNAGNTMRDATCVIIQNDLQKLGMKVNYQPIDFNILVDKVDQSLNWDAVVMGLTGDKIEPYAGANVWKSNGGYICSIKGCQDLMVARCAPTRAIGKRKLISASIKVPLHSIPQSGISTSIVISRSCTIRFLLFISIRCWT